MSATATATLCAPLRTTYRITQTHSLLASHDARAGTLSLVAAPLPNPAVAHKLTVNLTDSLIGNTNKSTLAFERRVSRLPIFAQITDEEHRRQSQLLVAQTLIGEFNLLLADLSIVHARYSDQLATLEKQRISPYRLQNAEGLVVNTKATAFAFETLTLADQLTRRFLQRRPTLSRCIAAAGRLELGRWAEETDLLIHETRHFLYMRHWSISEDATRVIIKSSTSTIC
ncbi:hypothetical protein BDF19DRAFT_415126 [Syncephalis fuscata]|nr:hypothetical protein BDF19DRAFT_415126 [Syncephalis fuscata]